jgi:hypothetical protein
MVGIQQALPNSPPDAPVLTPPPPPPSPRPSVAPLVVTLRFALTDEEFKHQTVAFRCLPHPRGVLFCTQGVSRYTQPPVPHTRAVWERSVRHHRNQLCRTPRQLAAGGTRSRDVTLWAFERSGGGRWGGAGRRSQLSWTCP